jgi:hypothetical protein
LYKLMDKSRIAESSGAMLKIWGLKSPKSDDVTRAWLIQRFL